MSGETSTLSDGIGGLISQFLPNLQSGVDLKKDEVSNILIVLTTMHRIAVSMEQELGAHRIGEQNRFASTLVNNLATEQLAQILTETGGKIIRPNFKKDK